MSRNSVTVLVCLLCVACEAKAKHEGGVAPERLSIESEACARTGDCADELRCVDNRCVDTKRSDVGDYHLAAGELQLSRGNPERAVKALRAAEAEYKRLGQIPTDVNCALGSALAELRADTLKAEEAAAKLHRCVQGLVDGSEKRRLALRSLATLAEAGFEPSHLAAAEVADRYLTGAPPKPKLENLTVTASADRKTSKKTFVDWMEALAGAEVRAAVAPCWKAHWEATKKKKLTVKLPYRYSFRLDPDDEARDRGVLKTSNSAAPADAAVAAATTCVENALAPIAEQLARRGGEYSWSAKFTLLIAP